jgi:hypothetical protein
VPSPHRDSPGSSRQALRGWTGLIALSFALGDLTIAVFPSVAAATVSVGVSVNVAMALAVGAYLGWTSHWAHLPASIISGAVFTTLGVLTLSFVFPYTFSGGLGLALTASFGAMTLLVATIGMSVLLGGAAAVTALLRVATRRARPASSPRLGQT